MKIFLCKQISFMLISRSLSKQTNLMATVSSLSFSGFDFAHGTWTPRFCSCRACSRLRKRYQKLCHYVKIRSMHNSPTNIDLVGICCIGRHVNCLCNTCMIRLVDRHKVRIQGCLGRNPVTLCWEHNLPASMDLVRIWCIGRLVTCLCDMCAL